MTTYLYTSSGPYSCQACNMGFSNTALLAKHKARFCIGDAGDMVLIRQCKRCREHKCSCEEVPEYERMREEEKRQCQDVGRPRRRQSNRSDESMSIHLIRDRSKYNPNNDPKLQSLAANHGKQMEFLSNRNKDLERQRDEIRRRLGALGKKPADTDNTSALLAELRDQEARNQRLLDELKKQLLASRQPVAIIGEQQQVQQKKTYTYPVYYGNSLVAEISAIRQAYIQSGGNDPEILAQLAQMLAEAQAIEEAMRNKRPPEPKRKEKKTTEVTSHVMTMDMENERLNRELLLLQEQNLMARNRRKDDREGRLPSLRLGLGGTLGSGLGFLGSTSRLGMSGLGTSGLGLTGTGLTLGQSSRYSSLHKPLYGSSTFSSNPLYKSILEQSDNNNINVGLLNSMTGRASVLGRPGTGLGYRSYRPGLSYRNSFLGEGGQTSVSKYGLNPSIRDSLELRNNNNLVDIGTSPISSSRLARPLTSLGLRSPVIVEPNQRKPYPLDSVLPPDTINVSSNTPYQASYISSYPHSKIEIELRDSFENFEEPYEYNETHPTVPKLKLHTDPPPEDKESDNLKEEEKLPSPSKDKKKKKPKPSPKNRPETRNSDGSRSSIVEPKPLKSALKNSKTLEPSSPSDLNNHPSNLKSFAGPDDYEVYDSDVIYDPVPDTVQNPPPKKPLYTPKVYEQLNTQKIIPIDSARPLQSTNQFLPIYSAQPYVSPVPIQTTTPIVSSVPQYYIQPITQPTYIPPANPETYAVPPKTGDTDPTPNTQSTQPRVTYLPMSHPDMYQPPPTTAVSSAASTPTSSQRNSRLRSHRHRPGVSPIPEESLSARPAPVGDSSPSPFDTTLDSQEPRRVLHSYPKPPSDPNDPYNYYARSGWPPVQHEKLHKDHKNYHPLNPDNSTDDGQNQTPRPNSSRNKSSTPRSQTPELNPEQKAKLEEQERKQALAEAKKQSKAQEAARKKEEAEAKKKAKEEEKAQKRAEEEAKKQARISEEARKKAEAEAKKKAHNAKKKSEDELKKGNVNNINTNENKNQNPPSKQTVNQNKTPLEPEKNYRFRDNFVGRQKQAETKKAVTFNE